MTFTVQTPDCACESTAPFRVDAKVSATNGDLNLLNNQSTYTSTVVSTETCNGGNTCTDQIATPVIVAPAANSSTTSSSVLVRTTIANGDANTVVTIN